MKSNHRLRDGRNKTRLSLIVVCLTVCLMGLTWGVSAVNNRPAKDAESKTTTNAAKPALPKPAQSGPEGEIWSELITAMPYGFEPKEITRPAGTFILSVDNRADHHGISLRLVTLANQLIRNESLYQGRPTAHQILNLPPGVYILTEANHPDWSCRITITQ